MNSPFFLVTFLAFLISSCTKSSENCTYNKLIYNPVLADTFFLSEMWSYPSFTTKDDNGNFDFAMDWNKDTSHLFHTANIFLAHDSVDDTDSSFRERGEWDRIRYVTAKLVGSSILLKFEEMTPSSFAELIIKIKRGQFFSMYEGGAPAIGNIYYDFDEQILILQKDTYAVGDTLRGYLDFKVEKPNYLHLKGAFKVKIRNNKFPIEIHDNK